jgi:hypothetical protein
LTPSAQRGELARPHEATVRSVPKVFLKITLKGEDMKFADEFRHPAAARGLVGGRPVVTGG